MKNAHSSAHPDQNKWFAMLTIVNQHSSLLQSNLTRSFKKLCFRRLLAENILVFLLQYTSLMFNTSLIWFATGTSCAFLFLRGSRILPSMWMGNFLACFLATHHAIFASGFATVYTLQAFLLLWCCYRYISPTLIFYRKKTYLKFIFCSGILTAMTSMILFPFSLQAWLANWNGILVISIGLLTLDAFFPEAYALKNIHKKIFLLCYSALLFFSIMLLFSQQPLYSMMFALTTLPFIALISFYFGWCGTVSAVFLWGLLLSLGAYIGAPLFNTVYAHKTCLFLQTLLCIETLVFLYYNSKFKSSAPLANLRK
jgi:hypothetical protein